MNIPHTSRYLTSLHDLEGFEEGVHPEIAFGGRSNVGKSSLINFLLGRKGLARISSTPGRTQAINFFLVDEKFILADLPGYGYAKAPTEIVKTWTKRTRSYVSSSKALRGVVLLLDVRRRPTREDQSFVHLIASSEKILIPVVTKCDKLSRSRRMERLKEISEVLGLPAASLIATSSKTGEGRDDVWRKIGVLLDD